MTMVERVAQALAREAHRTWEQLSDLDRFAFRAAARAAIEALRDPTPGMIEAAETHKLYGVTAPISVQAYRVMIARALSEGAPQ